ncbi:hypothetical protein V6N12_013400 [Hibiscus sabdariffa]|uniref:Retroviral polymerase SH3-like domain-containing protein n=1 Tax=Hibiscus sabdariffa TaxID=183260 RepID=A0ABR2D961_9ROSI
MTISGYFIGYAKKSKGYRFYCPSHNTRIVESRNAKFLENDSISGSDMSRNSIPVDQQSTLSERLVIIYNTPQAQTGAEQPINEVPQPAENTPVDQVVQENPEIIEQPVDQHDPQENNNKSGSRSKHIDIKYLAIRERVKEKKVVIEHISTEQMLADPLTKGMPPHKFKDHVVTVGLVPTL